MKKVALTLSLVLLSSTAWAVDPTVSIELKRLDQRISRVMEENDYLRSQLRALERSKLEAEKKLTLMTEKQEGLVDDMVRLNNVDVPNLRSRQDQLYDVLTKQLTSDFDAFKNDYAEQEPELNWGTDKRDCQEVNASHQEVKTVEKDGGKMTLRFLCFDGRVLHMGTQLNVLPE